MLDTRKVGETQRKHGWDHHIDADNESVIWMVPWEYMPYKGSTPSQWWHKTGKKTASTCASDASQGQGRGRNCRFLMGWSSVKVDGLKRLKIRLNWKLYIYALTWKAILIRQLELTRAYLTRFNSPEASLVYLISFVLNYTADLNIFVYPYLSPII